MASTESRSALVFSIELLESGFFVPADGHAPATSPNAFRIVHLPDISTSLQFFRARITTGEGQEVAASLLVINAISPAPGDDGMSSLHETMTAAKSQPGACFCLAGGDGWLRARAARGLDREVTAAAVAVVQFAASWDESEPIVVDVDGTEFTVSVSFADGRHRARVALID
jgi:hypothetical protein